MRASVVSMRARTPIEPGDGSAFKRQVVFRLSAEEWPLLEAAAREHGSIQRAVVAGLRALAPQAVTAPSSEEAPPPEPGQATAKQRPRTRPTPGAPAQVGKGAPAAEEEITAREAAQLLGVKTQTVSGYIRSG